MSSVVVDAILFELIQGVTSAKPVRTLNNKLKVDSPELWFRACSSELPIPLRHLEEDDLVTSFGQRNTFVHFHQLKVAEQRHGHFCGHFAYHFAACATKLCQSSDVKSRLDMVQEISSETAQWRRYWSSVKELCGYAKLADLWWPWTEEAILSGCMERTHMKYLVESHYNNVLTLQFGYGCFQDELDHIIKVNTAIESFCSKPGPSNLIFVVGVVYHWVCLMAHKTAKKDTLKSHLQRSAGIRGAAESGSNQMQSISDPISGQDDEVHVFYFDSRNHPATVMTTEEMDALTAKWELEDKTRGKEWSPWEKNNYKQGLRDQQVLPLLLAKCLSGKTTLISEYLDIRAHIIVTSYREHVSQQEEYLVALWSWLEVHHRPHHLRQGLLSAITTIGTGQVSDTCVKELNYLVEDVATKLPSPVDSEIALVTDFYILIVELKSVLEKPI